MTVPVEWRCASCRGRRVRVSADAIECLACDTRLARLHGVWYGDSEPLPERFDAAAADRLAALDEDDHFWVRQRRLLFRRLLDRVVRQRDAVVELGCGSGGMLPVWEGGFASVAAVDAYRPLLARARARGGAATLIQSDVCATPLADGQFDMAAAFDVIEHVDPDALLSEARRLVRPGGQLLVSAPAFRALWSAMDERAGHRCRYDSALLGLELRRNGWRYDGHTYFQCLLFPLVYLSRRLAGGTHPVERRPGRLIDRTLGLINRVEVAASSRFTVPFGSSIVAWATRT
jgi:SAM-dependent methyltransferase